MKLHAAGPLLVLMLVLMLLSCSAAEECNLPPKLQRQDLHKLSEVRWVLVQAIADYPAAEELMKNANSSIMELKLKENHESFLFVVYYTRGCCLPVIFCETGSEGKHLDAEELKASENEHKRMTDCLKFNVRMSFRYDRKAEFCLEKKEET